MRCALESRTSSDEEPRSLTGASYTACVCNQTFHVLRGIESWEVPSDEEAAEFPLPTGALHACTVHAFVIERITFCALGIPEAIVEEAEETGKLLVEYNLHL